jgi:hypothetical protein
MMSAIRAYLLNDAELSSLLNAEQAIYQLEKPLQREHSHYIIGLYKPINGGYVKDYQYDFRIIGEDLSTVMKIQSRLIELLDDTRNEKTIKDDKVIIRSINLINGGGTVKNPDSGNWETVVYFLAKI